MPEDMIFACSAGRRGTPSHAPISGRSQDSASESTPVSALAGLGLTRLRLSGRAEPHYHRCARCRERMTHACVDPSCAEGYQWVIVCFLCYEHMDKIEKETRGGW